MWRYMTFCRKTKLQEFTVLPYRLALGNVEKLGKSTCTAKHDVMSYDSPPCPLGGIHFRNPAIFPFEYINLAQRLLTSYVRSTDDLIMLYLPVWTHATEHIFCLDILSTNKSFERTSRFKLFETPGVHDVLYNGNVQRLIRVIIGYRIVHSIVVRIVFVQLKVYTNNIDFHSVILVRPSMRLLYS